MTTAAPLQSILGSSPALPALIGAGVVLVLVGGAAGVWWICGRGPRIRRAYQRVQRLLHEGNWQQALALAQEARSLGRPQPLWEGRLRNAEGECRRAAGEAALAALRFEHALEQHLAAAHLLNLTEADARQRVIDAMLAELRRRFATTQGADTQPVHEMVERVLRLTSPCSEAIFWKGLCQARENNLDLAIQTLRIALEGSGKEFLDPSLYLGVLLFRTGRGPESLRYLAEANRLEPNCPFVSWQLGTVIVHMGQDASLAVRALQRALAANGLPRLASVPERAWMDGLPGPERSFVQRLASQHPYRCPVMGGDVSAMIRQARLAIAHAHSRLGNAQEAAKVYAELLQEAAPSLPVLRGLGLSLARLERYDEAFKHLRAAHELEEPKDPVTAGYLALCAARGRPSRAEDRPNNVLWAIRLLGRFDVRGDGEWAGICNAVYAEARALGLSSAIEDLRWLCDVLASVDATDVNAAAAVDQLAVASLDAIRPDHAFLYCRAAQQLGFRGQRDVELFARTFTDVAAAQAFFRQRGWDFTEMEFTFLARWADQQPGRFPDILGPEYPERGQAMLLARSKQKEATGDRAGALVAVEVLHRLAPHDTGALDRLACTHYRQGNLDRAAQLLDNWHALEPADPLPLLRRAGLEEQRGDGEVSSRAIEQALQLTQDKRRAAVASLAAHLALASGRRQAARELLEECVKENPEQAETLWFLAALLCAEGDRNGLAAHAAAMSRIDATDPRFHYLAAVCHLGAADVSATLAAAERAAAEPRLVAECQYVIGLAHLHNDDVNAALISLEKVARADDAPSADHARALLGRLHFDRNDYDKASRWWAAIESSKCTAWQLDEALRGTVFLAGLQALGQGNYEQAADRFREAGRFGMRDRRLGASLMLALFKAGQRLLFQRSEFGSRQPEAGGNTAEAVRQQVALSSTVVEGG